MTEVARKLDAAKSELETVVKAFAAEKEKLRDAYEEKKRAVTTQVRSLEKKIDGLETDGSVEDRRVACEELVNAVKALLQRKTPVQ